MTKNGRPSLLNDIRLFTGESSYRNSYLQGLEEAVAYGRRIAWFLNGEGVSVGAFPSLYVLFTASLQPGTVQVTDEGGDWWQRYVHVGVTEDFPNIPNVLEVIMQGIVDALLALGSGLIARTERLRREPRRTGRRSGTCRSVLRRASSL